MMELPELPLEFEWVQGDLYSAGDWDVRIKVANEDISLGRILLGWVSDCGSVTQRDINTAKHWFTAQCTTQEEGMQLLAARLWLGMCSEKDA